MTDNANPSQFVPDGWHTVTPRVVVNDAESFVRFLNEVFGATGEYTRDSPSIVRIDDSVVMVSEIGMRGPTTAFLYVYVADTDATYGRAIDAGARSLEAPFDTPYGDRRSMVEDRWGNTWQIATHQKAGETA